MKALTAALVIQLLLVSALLTEGYYRCCRGLCYRQCGDSGCLCSNQQACSTDSECEGLQACSTPCSVTQDFCPEQSLQCHGFYCWNQCEDGQNAWCTDYANVQCLQDSQCRPFNCTRPCTALKTVVCAGDLN